MTNFNHSYLTHFGKVFFAAAYVAIISEKAISANTTVNLILSSNPTEYKVVRIVCGVDADMNGIIDAGSTTYDYFTQVNNQSVSFLSNSRTIKVSQFQAQGLSIAANSVYPASLSTL